MEIEKPTAQQRQILPDAASRPWDIIPNDATDEEFSNIVRSLPDEDFKKLKTRKQIDFQCNQMGLVRSKIVEGAMGVNDYGMAMVDTFEKLGPKDMIEEMIAIQMMGLQNSMTESLHRAGHRKMSDEMSVKYLAAAAKCSRAFAGLVDALDKHRGDRAQKMTVEHVHVHAGGQAIVGSVKGVGGRG